MPADTILTLANLKGIDLLEPKASDIDFAVLAEHLGKEMRFNGATPDCAYSVAQHLVIGAGHMLLDGLTEEMAAYFLLHDCQEAIWKDDPTPKKMAIARHIEQRCGVLASDILDCIAEIIERQDIAIHEAAGLRWPIPEDIHRIVKLYDVKMFVTEWRDLMKGAPHPNWHPYEGVQPLDTVILPVTWRLAAASWESMATRLLPALRRGRA